MTLSYPEQCNNMFKFVLDCIDQLIIYGQVLFIRVSATIYTSVKPYRLSMAD